MLFSDELIDKILYSNIQSKAHKRERSISFFKALLKNFRFLFYSRLPNLTQSAPSILFFSSKLYFDVGSLPVPVYTYKEKVPKGIDLNLSHEEHWLFVAFFMPRAIQRRILSHVYRSISTKLDRVNIRLFVCNNAEFISYVIAYYLKTRKATTVTMQHGTYSQQYRPTFYETDVADYCFVWGNVYKQVYIRGGVSPDAVKVVAPPFTYHELFNKRAFSDGRGYKPLFLGQQLYKALPEVVENYNRALVTLCGEYEKRGVRLSYKPHPREDIKKSLLPETMPLVEIVNKKHVSDDYFDQFTHAYSINSTALIKALCSGLQCYQINLEVDMPNEIYAEHTSVKWVNIHELVGHLDNERFTDNYISHEFINLQPKPAQYNSEILLQLMA